MRKGKVIEDFTLKDFDKLHSIQRAEFYHNEKGYLYLGDIIECDDELFDYINGGNPINKSFVEEIIEEPKEDTFEKFEEEIKKEEKLKKKKGNKKKKSIA